MSSPQPTMQEPFFFKKNKWIVKKFYNLGPAFKIRSESKIVLWIG